MAKGMMVSDDEHEKFEALGAEWMAMYRRLVRAKEHEDWVNNEAHFESLCVGWGMAKGMRLGEALKFYREMVKLGYF